MIPEPKPEWLRPNNMPKHFGIGRSKTYDLIAAGKVRSVSLRERGQKHGTRLISYDSVVAYLESLAEGGEPPKDQATSHTVETSTDPSSTRMEES